MIDPRATLSQTKALAFIATPRHHLGITKQTRITALAGAFCLTLLLSPECDAVTKNTTTETLSILQIEDHYLQLLPHQHLIEQQYQRYPHQVQHIFAQLRQHRLPQLALIPMMESSFNPHAISPAGASGLWQLMPATAKRFGLTVNDQTDERFDLTRSTDAAVAYLAFLSQTFNRDIPLILAAYNAGEGRVQRTLASQPDTPFYALKLPQETLSYVHKFYALKDLISLAALNQRAHPAEPLHPLSPSQKKQLAALFARREIINLAPIAPLIPL